MTGTGNWIQLASGGGYDFDTKSIFGRFNLVDDVAWPLSCPRYTRHTRNGLSWPVTCHSIAVARTIHEITGDPSAAAAGLLHDLHEAVIGDITTPVARAIDYEATKALKDDVQLAMYVKLGIPFDLLPNRYGTLVDQADQAALHVERTLFMAPSPREWRVPVPDHRWMAEMYRQVTELRDWYDAGNEGVLDFVAEFMLLVGPHLNRAVFEAAETA